MISIIVIFRMQSGFWPFVSAQWFSLLWTTYQSIVLFRRNHKVQLCADNEYCLHYVAVFLMNFIVHFCLKDLFLFTFQDLHYLMIKIVKWLCINNVQTHFLINILGSWLSSYYVLTLLSFELDGIVYRMSQKLLLRNYCSLTHEVILKRRAVYN